MKFKNGPALFLSALLLSLLFAPTITLADSAAELVDKSRDAASVLQSMAITSDHAIPLSLLEKSTCVATIPSVVRVGFIFGARYGKGLVSCRVANRWSNPSVVEIKGGSWGFQFGLESVDLVIVFVGNHSVERMSGNNFTLGADAAVAAGPVGRDAQAGTDYKLTSDIYSYSRSKGLFAGIAIQGTVLSVNRDDNARIYGNASALQILTRDNRAMIGDLGAYTQELSILAN